MLNLRWMRKNLARWVPERLKSRFRPRLFGYRGAPPHPGSVDAGADGTVDASFRGVRLRAPTEAYDDLRYHLVDNRDSVDELDALVRVARERGGTLLDVGAARGLLSALFCLAREGNLAVALEPSPVQVRDAQRLGEMNGLDGRMEVHPVAAGRARAELRGAVDAMGLIDFSPSPGSPSFPVEMTTVDDEVRRIGAAPDVLKIDVEGAELEVLQGARETLAKRPILFLEIHLDLLDRRGTDPREIVEMLERFGYRMETCTGAPLTPRAVVMSPGAVLRLVAR